VKDFMMNDKCSAGTGRFLEVMANTLAVSPAELYELAAQGRDTTISSMCTVFAESEVISLIGRGEKKEKIAFAVVDSIVQKVASQAGRLYGGAGAVYLTGGLCDSAYIVGALSAALGTQVISHANGRYAGSIGAALCAMKER
jgi:predicted CoA-substrate-specific enzyme activase